MPFCVTCIAMNLRNMLEWNCNKYANSQKKKPK